MNKAFSLPSIFFIRSWLFLKRNPKKNIPKNTPMMPKSITRGPIIVDVMDTLPAPTNTPMYLLGEYANPGIKVAKEG